MKTLGQIAYEAYFERVPVPWAEHLFMHDSWERAAQAVIAAYEAQKQCSADTGPKPTAAGPRLEVTCEHYRYSAAKVHS